jgi:hypothetical protein
MHQAPQPAVGEAALLLKIKSSWGDPPALAGWNASAAGAHSDWPHVGCDTAGRVANLTLASAGITGPFPDAIGDLSGPGFTIPTKNRKFFRFRTTTENEKPQYSGAFRFEIQKFVQNF